MPREQQRGPLSSLRQELGNLRSAVERPIQHFRAKQVLSLTREIIDGRPDPEGISFGDKTPEERRATETARLREYVISRATRQADAVLKVMRTLPSHKQENLITEKGLALFIRNQLILRRANTEEDALLRREADQAMNTTAFMPKAPLASPNDEPRAVKGSRDAYEAKARQLASRWTGMALDRDPNQIAQHPQDIINDLEEALSSLSRDYPHTPTP